MAAVAIYTASFGGFDTPPAQHACQTIPVTWHAYTDRPDDFGPPWQTVGDPPSPYPRMTAKRYKCLPTDYLDSRYSIWIDANTEIISPTFAADVLASLHDGLALFKHPQRDCIYQEAEASLRLAPAKYRAEPIRQQIAHYLAQGWPRNAGLYACGTIGRDHHHPTVAAAGRAWYGECIRWSYQDQLSFPPVMADFGLEPGILPDCQIGARRHFGNKWQIIHPHNSDR